MQTLLCMIKFIHAINLRQLNGLTLPIIYVADSVGLVLRAQQDLLSAWIELMDLMQQAAMHPYFKTACLAQLVLEKEICAERLHSALLTNERQQARDKVRRLQSIVISLVENSPEFQYQSATFNQTVRTYPKVCIYLAPLIRLLLHDPGEIDQYLDVEVVTFEQQTSCITYINNLLSGKHCLSSLLLSQTMPMECLDIFVLSAAKACQPEVLMQFFTAV